ncbi:TPA: TIGR03761 family integrating conjugative element protein [Pasteurella multocida]|nr:TIGR03761 family integrating conjugative element protein [Pasteurella multocida]
MTQEYNHELGALRSNITLTLHSQYATKMWLGRPIVREGDKIIKPQILSMPACLSILSQIQKDASNDDPYADWYLINFEDKVLQYTAEMKKLVSDLVDIYADNIPEGIDISRCANISPVTYPIYVNSQLGYKLIYLLSEFDMLARSVMTASHIAIMTKDQAREWLETGAGLIRKCFGVVDNYKNSGITRQDVRDNNVRYQEAIKRLRFELPTDILSGEKRAMFAPNIKNQQAGSELDDVTSDSEVME